VIWLVSSEERYVRCVGPHLYLEVDAEVNVLPLLLASVLLRRNISTRGMTNEGSTTTLDMRFADVDFIS
jgi:hypothetical protein